LKREPGARLPAELLAGLTERVAALATGNPGAIWRMAREHLAVLPNAEVDPAAVAVAARVLRGRCQATARCGPPGELSYAWRMPPLAPARRRRSPATVCPAQ
jgi:hypothetical protein